MKSEFEVRLELFLHGAQQKINDNYEGSSQRVPILSYEDKKGTKYIRIEYHVPGVSTSVHCFIDKSNGDVLKSASWKKPAPKPRGNIFNEDNGVDGVTAYGAVYLR